jgi:SMC interacting uncharacterized protein involved in chromosome segregation
MDEFRSKTNQTPQKRYRKSQTKKGLVRFEIQVEKDTKARFDRMVNTAADELVFPEGKNRRIAKARARIFDELTQQLGHNFFTLRDEIDRLKSEIKALSPAFFKDSELKNIPLPAAIESLDDNPAQLKQLLAKTYKRAQEARLAADEHKRRADQFEALYEAQQAFNEDLEKKLWAGNNNSSDLS